MNQEALCDLVDELRSLDRETEWVEFKHNNADPQMIGEYVSALSNSAALHRKPAAYILWGIDDSTHQVVGTSFKPRNTKVAGQELENWLTNQVVPQVDVRIHEFAYSDDQPMVLFEIRPAARTPVRIGDTEYIRVGSYKKKLRDHPEKERALWATFSLIPFEDGVAMDNATSDDVLRLIEYPTYFELMKQTLPDNRVAILQRLCDEKVILRKGNDRFQITNVGAILFAKDLREFLGLKRKSLRVIRYKGKNRTETIREQEGVRGYAVGFSGAIQYINGQLPANEEVGRALRSDVPMYPEIAIRELVANALIHQDFSMSGTGPMVEIFSDRVEITNPGKPLVDTLRFIDCPPQSRNETLASIMRRIGVCEERGSGIDKVVFHIELFQLPAPDFNASTEHTRVILFAPRSLADMDQGERIRACYQHACLCWVSNERMTNSSLRKRFGIDDKNYSQASKIISDTLEAKLIKPFDPGSTSKKHAKYLPFWG